jgi:large subunit ribosomal protein L18
MITKRSKNDTRKARQRRVRKKVSGTPSRPRLNVYRSLKNIYAQIIDDTTGTTLVSASSLDKEIAEKVSGTGNKEAARLVGKMIGEKAQAKGIESVVFDRAGYIYHGRVKEVGDGARESGLKF